MQTQGKYRFKMLILGVTAALASCLLALALAAPSAQAATQRGDLAVSQTAGPDPLESGYLMYSLTVKHEAVTVGCGYGCYSSGQINVTDALPTGVELVDVSYPTTTSRFGYNVSISCLGTSTVDCTISNLYDADSVDIDIVVKPTEAGAQTLTNTATVRAVSSSYPDPDTTNNSSTATTQVSESYTPPSGSYTSPPRTTLTQAPEEFDSRVSPRFSFTSNDANATFECKLDTGSFQGCSSPHQPLLLSEGQHTFQVRAKGASGTVDPTPARHTWMVDSLDPKIAFTQRPGNATGPDRWDEWVTNDSTPTWAWTVEDANPDPTSKECQLYDDTNNRYILDYNSTCSSPFTFGAELPDAHYYLELSPDDMAGNSGYAINYFEVDTVAPKFVSGTPTGSRVSPYADVVVTFDDNVHNSKQFVNIYKGSSNTPLAAYRYAYGEKKIEISPKNSLRRDTRYTVKVTTGVNDGANNLEAAKTWSFKTR